MATDERLELIYQEAIRALDHQVAKLDEFRARAATVLQSAAVVTAFLGAEAYLHKPGLLAWLAAVAFVVVATSTVFVLYPRDGWVFVNEPNTILEDISSGALPDLEATQRHLITCMAKHASRNEVMMCPISNAILVGVIALAAEAVLLLGALALR